MTLAAVFPAAHILSEKKLVGKLVKLVGARWKRACGVRCQEVGWGLRGGKHAEREARLEARYARWGSLETSLRGPAGTVRSELQRADLVIGTRDLV